MKTSPITWAIIRILTRRGKRHVKELRIQKGASLNQVKPVRVLDTPMKKQFFYALREE